MAAITSVKVRITIRVKITVRIRGYDLNPSCWCTKNVVRILPHGTRSTLYTTNIVFTKEKEYFDLFDLAILILVIKFLR